MVPRAQPYKSSQIFDFSIPLIPSLDTLFHHHSHSQSISNHACTPSLSAPLTIQRNRSAGRPAPSRPAPSRQQTRPASTSSVPPPPNPPPPPPPSPGAPPPPP